MTRIDDVAAGVTVSEGRIEMTARDDADLYVSVPDLAPLSETEVHATLHLEGDEFGATVKLDADALETLAAALDTAPEGEEVDDD